MKMNKFAICREYFLLHFLPPSLSSNYLAFLVADVAEIS